MVSPPAPSRSRGDFFSRNHLPISSPPVVRCKWNLTSGRDFLWKSTVTFERPSPGIIHRYEVPGQDGAEACDKLADLITTHEAGGPWPWPGATSPWTSGFAQWRDTYKAPSGLTPKSFGLYDEKYRGYIGPRRGAPETHRGGGTSTCRPS